MILLKKMMDELLIKNNIPGIYITRVQLSGGMLQLTGPCGKPLMGVPDVRIPHSKLNKDEREYIFSELTKFILENRDTIDEIINIHSNRVKRIEIDGYVIGSYDAYNSSTGKSVLDYITISNKERYNSNKNGYIQVTMNKKGKITFNSNNFTIKELDDFNFKLGEMVGLTKKVWKNAEAINKQDLRLAELKVCKA